MRLRELASVRVRYGYRRLHTLLRRDGWRVNHQRVYRLYRREGQSVRAKVRRQRASALRPLLPAAQAPNEHWSLDAHERQLGKRTAVSALHESRYQES